jgi:hypothetical protein
MTIKFLLDAILEDLNEEFKNFRLENQRERLVKINTYLYNLPEKQEEEDEAHFPFIVAKPMTGKTDIDDEVVSVFFLFGIHDDNVNKQGHADFINMLEKYKNHLIHKKFVKGFEILHPIEWEVQDEDTHPLYYGGIWTNWKLKTMRQEEDDFI